jgi:hypothetical protein
MSVTWMAIVAAFIAIEKTVRWRRLATYATAALLRILGVLLLTAPGSIPGLTTPASNMMHGPTPMGRRRRPLTNHRVRLSRSVGEPSRSRQLLLFEPAIGLGA